jgi:hypothetical protein
MDLFNPTVIAALIGAAMGVFGTLITQWTAKRSRKWQTRDMQTEELYAALAQIEQLTVSHITAIGSVVMTLLMNNDFPGTFREYHAFVNDPKFPAGYDGAKGVLEQALRSGRFRKSPVQEKLKQAISELYGFQQIGFLLKLSSYNIADAMTHANKLLLQLTSPPEEGASLSILSNEVMEEFKKALQELSGVGALPVELPTDLRTEADVLLLVKAFCQEWQRHAEMLLYGRRGLNRTLGELRFALPAV